MRTLPVGLSRESLRSADALSGVLLPEARPTRIPAPGRLRVGILTVFSAALLWGSLLVTPGALVGQVSGGDEVRAASPALASFGERMVGTWEDAGSRHVFAWAVGRQGITSRSYAAVDGEWQPVSQGFWWWDPGDEVIRGRVVAVDMGIELFEYVTRVEEDEIVHELTTHGAMGGTFIERWVVDADVYRWSLEQAGEAIMGGVYQRVR